MPHLFLHEALFLVAAPVSGRKRCGISSEPREPYQPRIFSHSVGRGMEEPEIHDDFDEEFHFLRYAKKEQGSFASIAALGELASQNERVLCIIMQLDNSSIFSCRSKGDAKFAADAIARNMAAYLEMKNILVIGVLSNPAPFLMRKLRDRGFMVARFSRRGHEWVKDVLKAHQAESGFEWFTEDALEFVAKRVKGRVAHAMGWCGRMAEMARQGGVKFPLDAGYVKKGGMYEGNRETVGYRF